MTGDASIFGLRDERAQQIAASWESSRRRKGTGIDRPPIVAALVSALDGGPTESIRFAIAAASYGAAFATTLGTLDALVDDLDDLEGLVLQRLGETDSVADRTGLLTRTRKLHTIAALARRSAVAAYSHTVSTAARKRVRMARHDIANAIGTVRNAILLMEDEAGESAREHFRTIAKRNSHNSEMLVRLHLSDHMALTPALGWEELPIQGATGQNGIANVGAVETVLDAIRAIFENSAVGADDDVSMSVTPAGTSAAVLTIDLSTCDDGTRYLATHANAWCALRDFATAVGLRLEEGADNRSLHLLIPLSARDERNDLAGPHQRHHADAVTL